MRAVELKKWLTEERGKGDRQASDNVSRVKRVEREFSVIRGRTLNIDDECGLNGCSEI